MDTSNLKQGFYKKAGRIGRAWLISVNSVDAPVYGERIAITKKSTEVDIVEVRNVTTSFAPWICTFWRADRAVAPAARVATPTINPSDFLDTPDAPVAPTAIEQPAAPVASNGHAETNLANAIAASLLATTNKAARQLETRIDAKLSELESKLSQLAARPLAVTIEIKDVPPITLEGMQHPMFEKVLRLVNAGLNVMLIGPAGCGKTFLAHQLSQALQREFGTVHCTAGMSESHVSGWLLPTGEGGAFAYHPADFVRLYANGNSVFLLDEIDAADPNVLMFLNGALANGALHIPHRLQGSEVNKGKNVSIIAAANTFGHGANAKYQGRNALDGATLDRFYPVEMDYDKAREAAMFGDVVRNTPWKAAGEPTANELAELGQWVLTLRERANASQLRRIVSSRTLEKALTARKAGIPTQEVKRDILAGWTADELAKVGER